MAPELMIISVMAPAVCFCFEYATGMLARCEKRHRHQEYLRFLRLIQDYLEATAGNLILDNYATHKHLKVKEWLKKTRDFTRISFLLPPHG